MLKRQENEIAQEAVDQQQRRAGPGNPVTPVHAVDGDAALFRAMNFSDLRNPSDL